MIFQILLALTTGILGIFLGAQITEAVLFVPHWKTMQAKEFFALHQTFGKKIYQFFAPLTIAATLLPLSTVIYGLTTIGQNRLSLILLGISTLAFFSTYYLFFKKANQQFSEASISDEQLPRALQKWGNWHWGRIVFESIAFVIAIIILMQS